MSIKSEKAKEYLSQVGKDHFGIHPSSTAYYPNQVRKAVELAESDARERAVKSMCRTVEDSGYDCSDHCRKSIDGIYCSYVQDFINNYDNDR